MGKSLLLTLPEIILTIGALALMMAAAWAGDRSARLLSWLAVATIFFLLSLIGPLVQGANTSSKVVLALMHLGAFSTIVPAMLRSAMVRRD